MAELKLCQPVEIAIIQVRGARVLSEDWLDRKRQYDQRRQEVKGVKRIAKNAQESLRGRQKDVKIKERERELENA